MVGKLREEGEIVDGATCRQKLQEKDNAHQL